MKVRHFLLHAAGLCAVGCNYDPRPEPLALADAVSTVAAERRGIWVEPSEIIDCGATVGTAGEVRWNFTDRPGVGEVQIDVHPPGSDAAMPFARGGSWGLAPTGPWLRPGLRFVALDVRDKRMLGVAQIRAYPCG